MVSLLILYAIFCLTTGLTAYITLIRPVLNKLALEHPDNALVESPVLATMVFVILATLVAPIMFVPSISGEYGDRFKEELFTTLSE